MQAGFGWIPPATAAPSPRSTGPRSTPVPRPPVGARPSVYGVAGPSPLVTATGERWRHGSVPPRRWRERGPGRSAGPGPDRPLPGASPGAAWPPPQGQAGTGDQRLSEVGPRLGALRDWARAACAAVVVASPPFDGESLVTRVESETAVGRADMVPAGHRVPLLASGPAANRYCGLGGGATCTDSASAKRHQSAD